MKQTTKDLIKEMKNSRDYQEYISKYRDEMAAGAGDISQALTALLEKKDLKKAEVIARSGIETHYAYQIFSGTRTPSRNKVIQLCIGLCLTVDEVQRLLKSTGYPSLYGKNERDNVILFGITKGLSVIDLNTLLYDLKLEILE